jgi:hypothetical protein
MALFKRDRSPEDRITSEDLAAFGRWEFLKEQSGVEASSVYGLIAPLNELVFTQSPADRAILVSELHRHAEKGSWEKVGAWKYVREFLDQAADTQTLIDAGLLAVHEMHVTNLRNHLAPIDTPRYEELTGGPVPHDGFVGPPVFNSSFGPTQSYYFDNALTVAAARMPTRVQSTAGVEPGPVDDASKAMWDFGLLVHRGPLVVSPDIAFEPSVLRPAIQAAMEVDHARFAELVTEKVMDRSSYIWGAWSTLGAARFFEEFLDPSTLETPAYRAVVTEGVRLLIQGDMVGRDLPLEILTPRTAQILRQVQGAG